MGTTQTREEACLAKALYKVGDIVVTTDTVKVFDNRNRPDGGALPGWRWRIVEVYTEQSGRSLLLRYKAVAAIAPEAYYGIIRPNQISRKVG